MLKKLRIMSLFLALFVGLTAFSSSVCSTDRLQVKKNYTKNIIRASAFVVSVAALIWYLNSTGGEGNPDDRETWGQWFRGLGAEFSRALVSAIVIGVAESIFDLIFYGRVRSAAERPTKNIVWLDNGNRFPRVMTL